MGVLGVAFKANIRDARNSPAADVLLVSRHAEAMFDTTILTCRPIVTPAALPATQHGSRGPARLGGCDRGRDRAPGDRLGPGLRTSPTRRRTPSTALAATRLGPARCSGSAPAGRTVVILGHVDPAHNASLRGVARDAGEERRRPRFER